MLGMLNTKSSSGGGNKLYRHFLDAWVIDPNKPNTSYRASFVFYSAKSDTPTTAAGLWEVFGGPPIYGNGVWLNNDSRDTVGVVYKIDQEVSGDLCFVGYKTDEGHCGRLLDTIITHSVQEVI